MNRSVQTRSVQVRGPLEGFQASMERPGCEQVSQMALILLEALLRNTRVIELMVIQYLVLVWYHTSRKDTGM